MHLVLSFSPPPPPPNHRFLDRAAIRRNSDVQYEKPEVPNPWKLCRVTQVENAKIILSMVPVFCCTIIMTLCLAQLQTFSVQQGYTMRTRLNKHFNIPPASLPIIPVTFLIIIVPIYDRIFVPVLRKITGIPTGVTHLQRIGVGLILSSISMAVAAVIEVKRKRVARDNDLLDAVPVIQPLPVSALWLSFQYFIFGIADMFTYIGLLEFFYSEAPKGLESTSTCFLWTSMALGYFLSTIVVKCVNGATKHITRSGGWLAGNNINRDHLNLFYLFLSILSLINFFIYLFVSKRYNYRSQGFIVSEGDSKPQGPAVTDSNSKTEGNSNADGNSKPQDLAVTDGNSNTEGNSEPQGGIAIAGYNSDTEGNSKPQGITITGDNSNAEGNPKPRGITITGDNTNAEGNPNTEGNSKPQGLEVTDDNSTPQGTTVTDGNSNTKENSKPQDSILADDSSNR